MIQKCSFAATVTEPSCTDLLQSHSRFQAGAYLEDQSQCVSTS